MSHLSFLIRRIRLLVRGVLVDRDHPPFAHLSSIEDPEEFVWAILPHAARSFSVSILLLPEKSARVAAVGYLYARMLDTYEDLSLSWAEARTSLAGFADRYGAGRPGAAPPAPTPADPDARDRVHLLLLERYQVVDDVFLELSIEDQQRVTRLVQDMASAMSDASTIFERQGGVLDNQQQVLDYCRGVIGLPALFAMDLLVDNGSGEHASDALEVSELIQLANITRDVEKDLQRGVAYHPALKPHLGSDGEGEVAVVVASARRDLMSLAIKRVRSFRRLLEAVDLPRLSAARVAAVLMMLFTERHYGAYSEIAEAPRLIRPRRVTMMMLKSLPAAFSPRWADRILIRVEEDLLAAA